MGVDGSARTLSLTHAERVVRRGRIVGKFVVGNVHIRRWLILSEKIELTSPGFFLWNVRNAASSGVSDTRGCNDETHAIPPF